MQAIKQAVPNLLQKAATSPTWAASGTRESVQDVPASEDELDSMTGLLADYIGPVATLIMEEHETKSTSANNLAAEISKEIPQQEKQEEFLKRWELMSISRRALISKKKWDYTPDEEMPRPLQADAPSGIGSNFMHYIGTIAKTVLRQNH